MWYRGLVALRMWDLPRPGMEPVSSALAGGFFTTEPPGSPRVVISFYLFLIEEQLLYSIVLVSAIRQHEQRCYKLKEGRPRCEL